MKSTRRRGSTKPKARASTKGLKAWAGRFGEETNRLVEAFTASVQFDQRLYSWDIQGSLAHCRTLQRAGILTATEAKTLIRGLEQVQAELDRKRFRFHPGDEDIHMAIERRLTELVGPVGGKLHTGRSRNDQVATDLRLYLRDMLATLRSRLEALQRAFVSQARANLGIVMPGYTHLQRAQPVLVSHHWLAYVEMLERDKGRLADALVRLNVMPLGSGALAGTNYPVDRQYTAQLLSFPAVSQNSLDAVSDRDFVVEVLAALAVLMMHLSRLSEELILWASQEFRFVDLPDRFCTGSSMMPQKKNPDVPELVRGKTGRVYGHLMGMLTTLKGLPLSYNRDMQEDKEALFDALDTAQASVEVLAELVQGLRVNRPVVEQAAEVGGMLATELADYLVLKGLPFRETHAIVGQIVRYCIEKRRELADLSLGELKRFAKQFEADVMERLTVQGAIERKSQTGGTGRQAVAARLVAWEKRLA
ncbi:Argininosuccinate lyase [Nitrospira tepida]|uniref:Argininosuccinate lyase n=1 Tax=Nitrospira tepida TaxID=2973512 RepID=A0AA86MWN9_9BACT|nr:argininosuccinate lyase [Nitrospira tepida]CAI4030346.1 Argininosuccinate lyase [Nitrospira tepida]